MIRVVAATTPALIVAARTLIEEYALEWPGGELESPEFEAELTDLPGVYGPPGGTLLLAFHEDEPVGCIGLRPVSETTCEAKRLYVVPEHRGRGVGRELLAMAIGRAREGGFTCIRLDTDPSMVAARTLYECFGFRSVGSAQEGDRVFYELRLHADGTAVCAGRRVTRRISDTR
jgi:GNAT superfamily N-acetyltransferase